MNEYDGDRHYQRSVQTLRYVLHAIAAVMSGHILFRFLRQAKAITAVCAAVIAYYMLIGNLQTFAIRTQQLLLTLFAISLIAHLAVLLYLLILLLVHRVRIKKRRVALYRTRLLRWTFETVGTSLIIVGILVLEVITQTNG